MANVAALLGGLLELGQGLNANAAFPALSAPTIDVPPVPPPGPATPVATLRDEFVDHHEHVLGSSLGTVKRYSSATQHLVDYAVREGIADARNISASKFTRYLREIEVAANGHNNASPRSMSEKTISFMLQTCGSMYRFGVDQNLLPQDADRTFRIRGIRKLKTRRTKPIFVFDAANELKFFQAAGPWAFAIHLTLAKTGLRPGELAHTLIEELDLDAGWWRVRGKPELGWMVKTGTDRDVPLAPEVCHVLKVAIGDRTAGPVFRRVKVPADNPPRLTGDRAHLARVATSRLAQRRKALGRKLTRREEAVVLRSIWRDSGALRSDRIRYALIRVAESIGVEATCPKSWRHTFATLLQEANVDPLIRQITLGHQPARPEQSALGMTAVYTHTTPAVQHREILRALQLRREVLDQAAQLKIDS